ncbi:MAG: potassium transporter Kef [Rhodospirillales bacterium]|nr:potassium transporter Kef [Rhodospirillales bacterium]
MTAPPSQTDQLLFSVLLQLIIMIGAARAMNTMFRKLGQPGVIGEIVAGLLLGPSLLGHFFPAQWSALFGSKSSPAITVISQIGLILLMFQIGMDFEFGHLKAKRNRRAVVLIALASVAVPFSLGLAIGEASSDILAPNVDRLAYSLFVGVALAITAVPILGRILREFELSRTEVGVVAISAAAINDVIGWVTLASVSAYATVRLSSVSVALQLGGIVLLVAVFWLVLRPFANMMISRFPVQNQRLSPTLMAVVLCLVFAMGIWTFELGIFAIFGGFAAGLLFHRHEAFVTAWRTQVGQFVLVFFLPIFFTFTGLRTNLLGLNMVTDFQWLILVLVAAVLGKIIPVYIAARISGFNHNESAILGSLMNTRALMELIVLNIGYDLGFLPQNMFTMLVIMAVVTTVMTGPLLKLLLPRAGYHVVRSVEA